MPMAQEKAAGVGAPEAAEKKSGVPGIGANQADDKALATLRAEFARRGQVLDVQQRGGRALYVISRWAQSRMFTHLHDVDAFLRQISGGAQ